MSSVIPWLNVCDQRWYDSCVKCFESNNFGKVSETLGVVPKSGKSWAQYSTLFRQKY